MPAPPNPARIDGTGWAILIYLALIANGLAYWAWFRVVRALPATLVGIGSLAVPCVGVLSSSLLLEDRVTLNDLGALALVCAALGLVLSEPRRPARSEVRRSA